MDTLREATQKDLPKGAEAQCVLCWRIFGSDSTCEKHKPYKLPVTTECKDPISIGLIAKERRGLRIWAAPPSERMALWLESVGGSEASSAGSEVDPSERPGAEWGLDGF